MPSFHEMSDLEYKVAIYAFTHGGDRAKPMIDRPPIDWSQPVQWNTGEPVLAEKVCGHVLVTIGDVYPWELNHILEQKIFKDSIVVYEDDGTIIGHEAEPIWVENANRVITPMEAIIGTF